MDYKFQINDKVVCDTNFHGVNPRIEKVTIINQERIIATSGYPAENAYWVKFENGVIGCISENTIINQEGGANA